MNETETATPRDFESQALVRCLGCGERLYSEESRRVGAGAACRDRLGADELARRRAQVLTGERAHLWLSE